MTKLLPMKFLVLAGALIIVLFSFFPCASKPMPSPTPDLETVAIAFVNFLNEGKFDEGYRLFNQDMTTAISVEELRAGWSDLLSKVDKEPIIQNEWHETAPNNFVSHIVPTCPNCA